jgi:hypothetical protein
MQLKLPSGYYVELGADLLTLRRHDGSTVATFSVRGFAMKLVEGAAWQDLSELRRERLEPRTEPVS